jgi:hypothetical protein
MMNLKIECCMSETALRWMRMHGSGKDFDESIPQDGDELKRQI